MKYYIYNEDPPIDEWIQAWNRREAQEVLYQKFGIKADELLFCEGCLDKKEYVECCRH